MTQTRSCGKRPSVAFSGALAGLFAVALILGGCVGTADSTASEQDLQSAHSTDAGEDYPMSGEYRIGPDGLLLQPERFLQEPVLQKNAREHTPQGAAAFVRYWIKLLEYSWNTGDTTTLSKVTSPETKFGQNIITMIDDTYASGGWGTNFKYNITEIEPYVPHPTEDGRMTGLVHVTEKPAVVYFDGRLGETEEKRTLLELHVCETSDSWVLCSGDSWKDVGQ